MSTDAAKRVSTEPQLFQAEGITHIYRQDGGRQVVLESFVEIDRDRADARYLLKVRVQKDWALPMPVRDETPMPRSAALEDLVQGMLSRERLDSHGCRVVRYHRVSQGASWEYVRSPSNGAIDDEVGAHRLG